MLSRADKELKKRSENADPGLTQDWYETSWIPDAYLFYRLLYLHTSQLEFLWSLAGTPHHQSPISVHIGIAWRPFEKGPIPGLLPRYWTSVFEGKVEKPIFLTSQLDSDVDGLWTHFWKWGLKVGILYFQTSRSSKFSLILLEWNLSCRAGL